MQSLFVSLWTLSIFFLHLRNTHLCYLDLPYETWNPAIILDLFLWKLNPLKNMSGEIIHTYI